MKPSRPGALIFANPYLLAALTVLSWSTSATAFKLSLARLDIFQLLLYSSITAVVLLALILLCLGKYRLLFSLSGRDFLISAGMGILNPLTYYLMVFKAYDLLPAQVAQSINYTWPIMLTLLSVLFLKQSFRVPDALAALFCYAGALIVSTQGSLSAFRGADPAGLFLAMACTIIWAVYWVVSLKINRDPVVGLFLNFCCSLPFVFGACVLFSDGFEISLRGLAGAVWVGCFEFAFPFVLWISALKASAKTGAVANLIYLTPFISLIFIHFILKEPVWLTTLAGLGCIIAGLVIQQRKT